jgi:hypothetical protein
MLQVHVNAGLVGIDRNGLEIFACRPKFVCEELWRLCLHQSSIEPSCVYSEESSWLPAEAVRK